MTLGVYARVMLSGQEERDRLRILVEGTELVRSDQPAPTPTAGVVAPLPGKGV